MKYKVPQDDKLRVYQKGFKLPSWIYGGFSHVDKITYKGKVIYQEKEEK